jgi:WXG100 family type VII secretion target
MGGRIAVSYEALQSANSQIIQQTGDMDGKLGELRNRLDMMDWGGDDQVAYEEKKLAWDQSYAKILEILEGVGNAVRNAMERYQVTEAANAARFR